MEFLTNKFKELLATLSLLYAAGTFEIRIIKTASGYFTDHQAAVAAIEPYIGKQDIYITLNPPDTALLSRSENKLTLNAPKTTADSDITQIVRLLVDIDPVRKSGTAATNEEKREAYLVAATVRKGLRDDFNFPVPVVADSGNGYHLVYQVMLDNTRENAELLKNLLRALDLLYSNEKAHVDRSTYNPARIMKLWGTMACKGDNSEERPHRWSSVIQTPDELATVPMEAIQRVIAKLPTADTTASGAKKRTPAKSIDAEKWLADHGIPVFFVKDDGEGNKTFVLSVCPWRSEHTNQSAYVMQFKDGALAAGCHHNSCQGEDWHTLREKYEPKADRQSGSGEETHFEKIIRIAEKTNIDLFCDQKEEPHAIVPVKNHTEAYRVDSSRFKQWFARQYFLETRQMFSDDAWTQAKGTFSGTALFDGNERRMFTRCAWHDGVLYYDLNDEDRQVVRVTAEGWEIVTEYDVLFYRNKTMASQVAPVFVGGDISMLDKYYRFKNKDDRLLHYVSLITKLLPQISHPLDVVYGVKGASKTTTLRKDKSLIDPDRCDIIGLPKTKDDLAIMLDKHYFLCLDNITNISSEISDLLCIACTGGVHVKRKLYTNDDEVILEFKQPVSMSGINVVATKPDLLDRCLLQELDQILTSERITEAKMWVEFNTEKAAVLGMIFTVLSKAIEVFPSIELDDIYRMSDFTEWGYAVAEAAGIGGQRFLDAYANNQSRANDEAVASHPVASAVIALMANKTSWYGNASDLLTDLTAIANVENIDTKSFLWPKLPNGLSRRLNEVKTNLEQLGFIIESQTSGTRLISIRKKKPTPATTTSSAPVARSIPSATPENTAKSADTADDNNDVGCNGDTSGTKEAVAKTPSLQDTYEFPGEVIERPEYSIPIDELLEIRLYSLPDDGNGNVIINGQSMNRGILLHRQVNAKAIRQRDDDSTQEIDLSQFSDDGDLPF